MKGLEGVPGVLPGARLAQDKLDQAGLGIVTLGQISQCGVGQVR